ncbi:type I glyceraldehyde-3-phosphate dehydrogenase [Myxococcota bacterium]|nr:type I glyceraldehyde-3-phosphate dehydrogenase [Myxococcota bacterium]MBU1534486.1 type I glyceraldehyde-3-phosphate dehydrogenase [Myxococcota bacterium]
MTKIAINGFGRIGRAVTRILSAKDNGFEIVAINDLTSPKTLAHLLKYDSVHGKQAGVKLEGDILSVGHHRAKLLAIKNPAELPWAELDVDIVLECTGIFRDLEGCSKHLSAGAKKVIISAPAKEGVATFVMGINHESYDPSEHHIMSNASCTTNCLAPVLQVLHSQFGVKSGLMTTIHSYTNDQRILDLPHSDLRRARAAAVSMIPTSTGAAKAIGLVIPELNGLIDGLAVRVPTPNVSLVDLVAHVSRDVTAGEVNEALIAASKDGPLAGRLFVTDEPLVSIDFQGDMASSTVDLTFTSTAGSLVKVISWYDNEYGYSARLVDLAEHVASQL